MDLRGADGYPFSTIELACRLEAAEGHANAESVSARARLWPESGATWRSFEGTFAMFDGVGSPLTQTFGLGLLSEATPDRLREIEAFFTERGASVFHEVSPMAEAAATAHLTARGYVPVEFTNVMCRPVSLPSGEEVPPSAVAVRRIERDEQDAWTAVAAEGWSEFPEVAEFMRDIGAISCERRDAACFLAELEGRPIGTGVLSIHDRVALLAGASTIPSARRQGAQLALLHARLRYAAQQGCDLAMMCALPGSRSQRNAERHGFRIAYTRVKWGMRS